MMWTQLPTCERRYDPFRELEREMNRVFHSFRGRSYEFPEVNVWATDDEAVVTAELPGLSSDDIELTVVGNTLTLQGERESTELGENEVYQRRERPTGRFVRSIRLPFPVETEKVSASARHGVLKVTLPRQEATRPRKIAVQNA